MLKQQDDILVVLELSKRLGQDTDVKYQWLIPHVLYLLNECSNLYAFWVTDGIFYSVSLVFDQSGRNIMKRHTLLCM